MLASVADGGAAVRGGGPRSNACVLMMFRALGASPGAAAASPAVRFSEHGWTRALPRLTPLRDSRSACLKPGWAVVSSGFGRLRLSEYPHGPPRQLERLFTALARDLPGCPLSGNVGPRKGLFQPDQPTDRPPHQICQA